MKKWKNDERRAWCVPIIIEIIVFVNICNMYVYVDINWLDWIVVIVSDVSDERWWLSADAWIKDGEIMMSENNFFSSQFWNFIIQKMEFETAEWLEKVKNMNPEILPSQVRKGRMENLYKYLSSQALIP